MTLCEECGASVEPSKEQEVSGRWFCSDECVVAFHTYQRADDACACPLWRGSAADCGEERNLRCASGPDATRLPCDCRCHKDEEREVAELIRQYKEELAALDVEALLAHADKVLEQARAAMEVLKKK